MLLMKRPMKAAILVWSRVAALCMAAALPLVAIDVSVTPSVGPTYRPDVEVELAAPGIGGDLSFVAFGSATVSSFLVKEADRVRLYVPASSVRGPVDVHLVGSVTTVVLPAAFTYLNSPSAFPPLLPASGPVSGGTTVVISGFDLEDVTRVTFDGGEATIVATGANSVEVVTPAISAGLVSVVVSSPVWDCYMGTVFTGTLAPPSILGVAPGAGWADGGDAIAITGTGLTPSPTVRIGGALAAVVSATPGRLVVTTPALPAGFHDCVVTAAGGTATQAAAWRSVLRPVPTGRSPAAGPLAGGPVVVISGTQLGAVTGVRFGGVSGTIAAQTATALTVQPPSATVPGSVAVELVTPAGAVPVPGGYAYKAPPTVTGISPAVARSGSTVAVTVTGSGLDEPTLVLTVGGQPATIMASAAGAVTAIVPALARGPYAVAASHVGGPAAATAALRMIDVPVPTAVVPGRGLWTGGETVEIRGTGLSDVQAVSIAFPAVITATAADRITVVTPLLSVNNVPLTVTVSTQLDQVEVPGGFLSVPPAPVIASVSPAVIGTGGGAAVTIDGSELTWLLDFEATIGGRSATVVQTVIPPGSVVVEAPPLPRGPAVVGIRHLGGSTTAAGLLTVVAEPVLLAADPATAAMAGGSVVDLVGTGLDDLTAVAVGGIPAAITATGSGRVRILLPPSAVAGPVAITATAPTRVATLAGGFAYIAPPPRLDTVQPAGITTAGGAVLTLTGADLAWTAPSVRIGGLSATVTAAAGGVVTAIAPPLPRGPALVAIAHAGGTATAPVPVQVTAAPVIVSVVPSSGPVTGGIPVEIRGTGLDDVQAVAFAGTAATVTSTGSTRITVVLPAGRLGPVAVAATAPVATAVLPFAFTYVEAALPAPVITGTAPVGGSAAGGDEVTITGTDLLAAGLEVRIGGELAATRSAAADRLVVVAPALPRGLHPVVVLHAGGLASAADAWRAVAVPVPAGFSPSAGPLAGTTVRINGTGFEDVVAVTVGGRAATIATATATRIDAQLPPAAAGTAAVVLVPAIGATVPAGVFTYVRAPAITALEPSLLPAGSTGPVVIRGAGFLASGFAVTVDGRSATVASRTATTATVTFPGVARGTRAVSVTSAGGVAATAAGLRVVAVPAPLSASPASGPLAGGYPVVLSGSGFADVVAVSLGGEPAVITALAGGTATLVAPAVTRAGSATVAMTTALGTVLTSGLFTYAEPAVSAPVISLVSLSLVPAEGGGLMGVVGQGFDAPELVVRVGGVPALMLASTATLAYVRTPAVPRGTATVSVSTRFGQAVAAATVRAVLQPRPTAVTPEYGPASSPVTLVLSGQDLDDVSQVRIGGLALTPLTVSSTAVTIALPGGSPGVLRLILDNGWNSEMIWPTYTRYGVPLPSGAEPGTIFVIGGASVTITGSRLAAPDLVVRIGGIAVTVTSQRADRLQVVAPALPEGTYDVQVTHIGGSATLASAIRTTGSYPVLTGLGLGMGVGGESVTVMGTDLEGASFAIEGQSLAATTLTREQDSVRIPVGLPPGTYGIRAVGTTATVPFRVVHYWLRGLVVEPRITPQTPLQMLIAADSENVAAFNTAENAWIHADWWGDLPTSAEIVVAGATASVVVEDLGPSAASPWPWLYPASVNPQTVLTDFRIGRGEPTQRPPWMTGPAQQSPQRGVRLRFRLPAVNQTTALIQGRIGPVHRSVSVAFPWGRAEAPADGITRIRSKTVPPINRAWASTRLNKDLVGDGHVAPTERIITALDGVDLITVKELIAGEYKGGQNKKWLEFAAEPIRTNAERSLIVRFAPMNAAKINEEIFRRAGWIGLQQGETVRAEYVLEVASDSCGKEKNLYEYYSEFGTKYPNFVMPDYVYYDEAPRPQTRTSPAAIPIGLGIIGLGLYLVAGVRLRGRSRSGR
jgi:hypothetical protein